MDKLTLTNALTRNGFKLLPLSSINLKAARFLGRQDLEMSMDGSIKKLFQHYLSQLEVMVAKIPPEKFSLTLSKDMFNLEMNAKIAANFSLRGYCPLLNQSVVSFFRDELGKKAVQAQLSETINYLNELPEVNQLDDTKRINDKAGFSEVDLSQPVFIYHYIVPNILFHISIVYAIAR